jgi:uncharacterized protein (DUF488 family)
MPEAPGAVIWTVGTGHRTFDELVALLSEASIELLVDVRSYPKSHLPHFCRSELERLLPEAGIEYCWLGDDLGGLRSGGYLAHMSTPRFARGLERLAAAATRRRAALCCAEIDPDRCHRRHIADALAERGWQVRHLLHAGTKRRHQPSAQQPELPFDES